MEGKRSVANINEKLTIYIHSLFCRSDVIVIFSAEYERSLEESRKGGKAGPQKGSWVAEHSSSPKMGGRYSNSYQRFD